MSNFQRFKHFKEFIEIDYFTCFSKCYFALNAYIKAKFECSDREKIDILKEDLAIQNRFKELLNNATFYSNLKEFKQRLYDTKVKNEGHIISFEKVKIQSFQNKDITNNNQPIKRDGITYILKICSGKDEKISFECINSKEETIQEKTTCKYAELETELNRTKLSKSQRDFIKSCFDEEISQYTRNLMNIIDDIEPTKTTDYQLIYKGFIEILYQLRNALFHGEIDPKEENACKVYKLAYLLFKDFIYKLPTEI